MFQKGNITIKHPILLAPMAGVTDHPFRTICKQMGAGLVYTEFVSADGIIRENTKTLDLIKFKDYERPIGVQIFGDNPETVGKSAKYVYEYADKLIKKSTNNRAWCYKVEARENDKNSATYEV